MSNSKRNFYEILNASSFASFNELKSKYKQLILQRHPDKLQQQLESETNDLQIKNDPNNLEFQAITEAWNCLKDPVKRKQYDAELLLNKFHTHNNIYAHIKLSEMKKQPNTGDYYEEEVGDETDMKESVQDEEPKYLYTYDCRCGGQYIIDESAEQYCRSNNNHNTQINNSDNNGVDDDDDDADNKSVRGSTDKKNNIGHNISKYKNNEGSSGAGGSEGIVQDHDDDHDEEDDSELIVECSECSLVIILLNG